MNSGKTPLEQRIVLLEHLTVALLDIQQKLAADIYRLAGAVIEIAEANADAFKAMGDYIDKHDDGEEWKQ